MWYLTPPSDYRTLECSPRDVNWRLPLTNDHQQPYILCTTDRAFMRVLFWANLRLRGVTVRSYIPRVYKPWFSLHWDLTLSHSTSPYSNPILPVSYIVITPSTCELQPSHQHIPYFCIADRINLCGTPHWLNTLSCEINQASVVYQYKSIRPDTRSTYTLPIQETQEWPSALPNRVTLVEDCRFVNFSKLYFSNFTSLPPKL